MKRGLAIAAALALAGPAHADATDRAALEALRAQDLRVATIAYRLASANVALCPDRTPLSGLLVHDARQYAPALRPEARALFDLGDGPGVLAVVPGSPAARAGLRPNDRLRAIGGVALAIATADARAPASYDGTGATIAALDRDYAAGPVRLSIMRAGTARDITLAPVQGCATQVQLIPSRKLNASADGRYVTITTAIADYASTDDELAVVIAHEMAHNVLRHSERLDAQGVSRGLLRSFGKNRGRIRATEEEADRFGLYLLARAGYDMAAAPAFWTRFGRQHGLGIFADGTHPGERSRVAALEATTAEIEAKRSTGAPIEPSRSVAQ